MSFLKRLRSKAPTPVVETKFKPQLPQQQRSSEWKIGWKVANLLVDSSSTACFTSIIQDGIVRPYLLDDVAECTQYPSHDAPEVDHVCGFNAFLERSDAERYRRRLLTAPAHTSAHRENIVLLRVGLYGRVQEGTLFSESNIWGYKASKQRVADVFLPQRCFTPGCTGQAARTGIMNNDLSTYFSGTRFLRSLCHQHASASPYAFTPAQLSEHATAAFRWEEPQPPR